MTKRIEGVNWEEVQLAYQKGETCREIGERLSISIKAISHRCTREKWRQESKLLGELVGRKTVERLVDAKIKQIQDIQDEAIPIARLISTEVKKTITSMNGQELEPSDLNGLAQALKTANGVALVNAGWVQQTAVDVTSNGESLHSRSLELLAACRKNLQDGKVDVKQIDVEAIVASLKEED